MATLAESFLADLEDLSDDEPARGEGGSGDEGGEGMDEDQVRAPGGRAGGE